MFKRFAAVLTLLGLSVLPAIAADFNPQPDPPGRYTLKSGLVAIVGPDKRLYTMQGGKQVLLPPGPCKLQDGKTLMIGADGRVLNIGSHGSGAGAGKIAH
jgi:hypothetical protein